MVRLRCVVVACSSVVRSFRYVATMTAGQVITSLISATLTLAAARETAQRQMAAEERKKPAKVRSHEPRPNTG